MDIMYIGFAFCVIMGSMSFFFGVLAYASDLIEKRL